MKTKDTELDISSDYILFGKRSEMQMDDLIIKMAQLPPEEYRSIQILVDLLYTRKGV